MVYPRLALIINKDDECFRIPCFFEKVHIGLNNFYTEFCRGRRRNCVVLLSIQSHKFHWISDLVSTDATIYPKLFHSISLCVCVCVKCAAAFLLLFIYSPFFHSCISILRDTAKALNFRCSIKFPKRRNKTKVHRKMRS